MARTESKVLTCHPSDEQEIIDAMQKFHWSLLSSQDVKTVDNSQVLRGKTTYNVRRTEHYVKLSFSRDFDMPNLNEIKKLEEAYHRLPTPSYPKRFPISLFFSLLLSILFSVVGAIGCFLLFSGLVWFVFAPQDPSAFYEDVANYIVIVSFWVSFLWFLWHWVYRKFRNYYLLSYEPKMAEAERVSESNAQECRRIFSEMEKYQ